MNQSNKKNILKRFKENYGTPGIFLFAIIVIASYIKVSNFFGLVNMYSAMTAEEIQKVLFSIITFEMISSLIVALLGIITIYFFIRIKNKALICAFAFLILQPVIDGIVEIGYSKDIAVRPLIVGAVIFWIFWHFLGKKTSDYFKLKYSNK